MYHITWSGQETPVEDMSWAQSNWIEPRKTYSAGQNLSRVAVPWNEDDTSNWNWDPSQPPAQSRRPITPPEAIYSYAYAANNGHDDQGDYGQDLDSYIDLNNGHYNVPRPGPDPQDHSPEIINEVVSEKKPSNANRRNSKQLSLAARLRQSFHDPASSLIPLGGQKFADFELKNETVQEPQPPPPPPSTNVKPKKVSKRPSNGGHKAKTGNVEKKNMMTKLCAELKRNKSFFVGSSKNRKREQHIKQVDQSQPPLKKTKITESNGVPKIPSIPKVHTPSAKLLEHARRKSDEVERQKLIKNRLKIRPHVASATRVSELDDLELNSMDEDANVNSRRRNNTDAVHRPLKTNVRSDPSTRQNLKIRKPPKAQKKAAKRNRPRSTNREWENDSPRESDHTSSGGSDISSVTLRTVKIALAKVNVHTSHVINGAAKPKRRGNQIDTDEEDEDSAYNNNLCKPRRNHQIIHPPPLKTSKIIGPRDVITNPWLGKIKIESDYIPVTAVKAEPGGEDDGFNGQDEVVLGDDLFGGAEVNMAPLIVKHEEEEDAYVLNSENNDINTNETISVASSNTQIQYEDHIVFDCFD